MSNPTHIIRVTHNAFESFRKSVQAGTYEPLRYGNIVVFQIGEPLEPDKPLKPMITSSVNWEVFQYIAPLDIVTFLPPVEFGLAYGDWVMVEQGSLITVKS